LTFRRNTDRPKVETQVRETNCLMCREKVTSAKIRRRRLDESQRSMVGAKLETLTHGQTAAEMPIGMFVITRAKAAEILNVGERSVARARQVLDKSVPELVRAVERGNVAVSAAAEIAKLPHAEQRERILMTDV
jgi:hypothetical protein